MKMRKQRFMGAALVAIAALVVLLASTGENPEDQDATAALLVGPLGLYMIFTRSYVLYDGEPEAKARDEPEPRRREPHRGTGLSPWPPGVQPPPPGPAPWDDLPTYQPRRKESTNATYKSY